MDRNPRKFNLHKIKHVLYSFIYITIVNETYLIIAQQVLSNFLVPYALFN